MEKMIIKNRISGICDQLAETINQTLNQAWFYKAADNLPINIENLSYIIELFTLNTYYNQDYLKMQEAIALLKNLVTEIKRYLLPVIKERLGISYLTERRHAKKSHEFIYYSFIAYTFPVNLQKIEAFLESIDNDTTGDGGRLSATQRLPVNNNQ